MQLFLILQQPLAFSAQTGCNISQYIPWYNNSSGFENRLILNGKLNSSSIAMSSLSPAELMAQCVDAVVASANVVSYEKELEEDQHQVHKATSPQTTLSSTSPLTLSTPTPSASTTSDLPNEVGTDDTANYNIDAILKGKRKDITSLACIRCSCIQWMLLCTVDVFVDLSVLQLVCLWKCK